MTDAQAVFVSLRPLLIGVAYRILGSMWDAEDVVQEAFLRWTREDRDDVRDARAYLTTITSRLALDLLKSAQAQREVYVGPWLPEPAIADELGPLETAELRDSVSYATLHLMERLTPPQRAVFVLHSAFGLSFREIADIVGETEGNCRQLYHRAFRRLGSAERLQAVGPEHETLLRGFLAAASGHDFDQLASLLAEDVSVWNDGGGVVRAALREISGREHALAFFRGLLAKYEVADVRTIRANGSLSAVLSLGPTQSFVTIATHGGRISQVFALLNPVKLARMNEAALETTGAIRD